MDPLEQFSILPAANCNTNNFVNIFIIHIMTMLFAYKNILYSWRISNFFTYIFLNLFKLFKDIYFKNLKIKSKIFIPIFFFIFLLVFANNLLGMIPYTYSITSAAVFNFYIVLTAFGAINLLGVIYHKWNFFNIVAPRGIPGPYLISLVFFETISYFARVVSLTVRLFANILSGHILQHILILFVYKILLLTNILFIFPWMIVFIISYLEIAIAFLQAYVFITLILIYFNNIIYLH